MNELLKTVLAEVNTRAKALREAKDGEMHFSGKGIGAFGMMLIMDDANPMIALIAKALGIPDGFKATKVGGLWAAYNSGDRLTFAENKDELMGDEIEESVVTETKNHMGEVVFSSFSSWKSACKKVDAAVWWDGNTDICNAFVGKKPYLRGETRAIGEWDGETGSVFQDSKKAPLKKSITEGTIDTKQIAKGIAKALEAAGWSDDGHASKPGATGFTMEEKDDTVVFCISVAKNSSGDGLSSNALDKIIDKLFRDVRARGAIFTQPTGMSGTGWTHDGTSGSVMTFTVGNK